MLRPAAISLSVLFAATAAVASDQIEDLKPGFLGQYKVGNWCPVRVLVTADGDGFTGILDLSASDSDGVMVHYGLPQGTEGGRIVTLAANQSAYFMSYVKPGKLDASITARLLEVGTGKEVNRREFSPDSNQIPAPLRQEVALTVALGRPAGLDSSLIGKRPGFAEEHYRTAQLESGRELPARWYGYEGVNQVVLATSNPRMLDEMDLAAQQSLEAWVKNGGHLVVSISDSWQRVLKSFLGPMLPAEIEGTVTVSQLRELEAFAGAPVPIKLRPGTRLPKLVRLRGKLLVGTPEIPIVVQAPYGLGMVTLTALELDREPFSSWEAKTDFWIKLLQFGRLGDTSEQALQAYATEAMTDLSSALHTHLEQFEGISLVSFQWVALLIFLYILLIGPGDYFFVKRVLKRMELTWITFPTLVVLVSLGAWFGARWLKGTELRINKIDLVDLDQASGTVRGTSWFALFSPQVERYDIGMAPTLGIDRKARPADEYRTLVSWYGVPEDSLGGFQRPGGVGLFGRSYRYGPDAQSLAGVPIQNWAMKGFSARWHGGAGPTIDVELERTPGDHLRGTVTNRLSEPIDNAVLAFAHRVYPLGKLAPGAALRVERSTPEDLANYVVRRSAGTAAATGAARSRRSVDSFHPANTLLVMMFNRLLPADARRPRNDYLHDLDLSGHLMHQRAILIGDVPGDGARLKLGDRELTAGKQPNLTTYTAIRVLVPVKGSVRADDLLSPEDRDPQRRRPL
jgi:hypothetical protein